MPIAFQPLWLQTSECILYIIYRAVRHWNEFIPQHLLNTRYFASSSIYSKPARKDYVINVSNYQTRHVVMHRQTVSLTLTRQFAASFSSSFTTPTFPVTPATIPRYLRNRIRGRHRKTGLSRTLSEPSRHVVLVWVPKTSPSVSYGLRSPLFRDEPERAAGKAGVMEFGLYSYVTETQLATGQNTYSYVPQVDEWTHFAIESHVKCVKQK